MIDLHCHTTASDGLLTPSDLVARAKTSGVDVIAVTDHDTTDGVAPARNAANGVRVIAGIELSTRWNDRNVHMLGYFLDPDAPPLREAIATLRTDRETRAERIVARLVELGYAISMDDVREHAGGASLIVRPHIARALVAKGYVPSVRDAFTPDLIADGGRADVAKTAISPVRAIEVIRRSGGAAVIAHAAVGHHEGEAVRIPYELLDELAAAGLAGIEVEHPDHPPLVRDELANVAARLGLIATGGSDFHGESGHVLAVCRTTPAALAELEASAAR
jgi:predicted metal-dependent phosphoesterase TrpH